MRFLTFLTLLLPLASAMPAPQEDETTAVAEASSPMPTEAGLFWPSCGVTAYECVPGAVTGWGACGLRSTCERFNPNDHPSNYGKFYCVCQAGYRATHLPYWFTQYQHRMTWVNNYGDQTHRVFVRPGMECNELCFEGLGNPRDCDEVPLMDMCR